MAETLLIRLATENRGFRDWVLVDEQGVARSPVQTGVPDAGVIFNGTPPDAREAIAAYVTEALGRL